MKDLERILVQPTSSVREAIRIVDSGAVGIALVVDDDQRLIGTITDGDIRRAILSGVDQGGDVSALLAHRAAQYQVPTVASIDSDPAQLLSLMQAKAIRHIPLVDDRGRVVELALLSELVERPELPVSAVVMAGGLGTRLRPLTDQVPKPMLPLGGRPLMEWTLDQLRASGVRRVSVTTHYKGEAISSHFGDGRRYGVEISYLNEDQPLGTAGALGMMDPPREPVLVINGDILTQLNYRSMYDFHRDQNADMTVAVRQYQFRVPYGVVETEGIRVRRLVEKPSYTFFVNAGVYLVEPVVFQHVPSGRRFDMTDLIECLLGAGRTVASFPVREYWLDIGQHADYERAQDDVENGRIC